MTIDGTRRAVCAAGALALAGCAAAPPDARAGAIAELGASGRLRAAINFGNPILASRDGSANSSGARGVSVDLSREAAHRLGLPVELVLFNSAGQVVEAVKVRQVDLAFVAIDPVRAADMEYTAPYVIIEGAYLVRSGSALQRNEEVGRAGTRIAVGRGSAGVKQQLQADPQRVGGVRLPPGRFMVIDQAMGVPKGRTAAQAWLSGFIAEMRASGFVAAALQRHGIQGAEVAPPRPPG